MPILTSDQKRKLVELEGYDPSQYTTDDEGYNIVPLPTTTKIQPSVSQETLQPKVSPTPSYSQDSPLATFGKSALQAAPSAVGAGIGAGIGMGIGQAAIPIPVVGALLGGIGGGMIGGGLTKLAQHVVEPKEWEQNVALSQEQNPRAATLGNIAAMPLGGFYPNPKNIASGLGAIPKLLTPGIQPTAQELGNLANMGIGAGLGVAMPNIEAAVQGHEMPSLGQNLANLGLGAAFSTPNRLGIKYGFHDPSLMPPSEPTADMLTQGRVNPAQVEAPSPNDIALQTLAKKFQEQQQLDLQARMKELVRLNNEKQASQKRLEEFQLAKQELQAQQEQQAIDAINAQIEAQRKQGRAEYQRTKRSNLQEEVQKNQIVGQPEKTVPPLATTELDKDIMPDYTGVTEQNNAEALAESAADLEARRLEGNTGDKYSTSSATQPKTATQIRNAADLENVAPKQSWLDFFVNLAKKRGVNLQEVSKIVSPTTGKETSGVGLYSPRKEAEVAQAFLKKGLWGADTPPHELDHSMLHDMRASGRPGDKKIIGQLDTTIRPMEDFQRWAKEREAQGLQATPEEYLVTDSGEYAVNRALNSAKETPLRKWWNDYKSYVKTRFGKHATYEELQRVLTYKLYHDKPFNPKDVNVSLSGTEQEKQSTDTGEKLKSRDDFSDEFRRQLGYGDYADEHGANPNALLDWHREMMEDLVNNDTTAKAFLLKYNRLPGLKTNLRYVDDKIIALTNLATLVPSHNTPELAELQTKFKQYLKKEHPQLFVGLTKGPFYSTLDQREFLINKLHAQGIDARTAKLIVADKNYWLEHEDEISPGLNDYIDTHIHKPEYGKRYRYHQGELRPEALAAKEAGEDLESSKSFLPPLIRPEVEKIGEIDHPKAKEVANAATNFYDRKRSYEGKLQNDVVQKLLKHIANPFENPKEYWMQDNKKMQDVVQYLYDLQDKGSSTINPDKDILKIVQDSLAKERAAVNAHQTLAAKNVPQKTLPQFPARPVLDILLNRPGSNEASKLWKEWDDYYVNTLGKTQAEADKAAEVFRKAYIQQKVDLASQYAPIDDPNNLGIPQSWRSKSLLDIMSRHTARVARRLAYFESFQDNPSVMSVLQNQKDSLAANDTVKNVLEDIAGVREHEEVNRTAISGLVRAGMMGTLTGAKDLVTAHTLPFQHLDIAQTLPAIADAWKNIRQNWKESFEAGVNKDNIAALEFTESEGGIKAIVENMRRFRDVLNTVQGRNFLEKTSRSIDFGIGKWTAQANLQAAIKNRMTAQQRKFADDFFPQNWQQYKSQGNFPPEILQEIAAKFVESVQGSYNYKGLPSIAQKGTFAPYLSLARWNIEKLNNFDKYVVQPAKEGNLRPLLMSTLGMVLGGEAVNQIVQLATKRKEKTPNVSEIKNLVEEGEPTEALGALTYKLAALASYAGYAGVAGDVAKMALDKVNKNNIQTYNNPLIGAIETGARNAGDIVEAIQNGDLNITADAINQFLEDTLQVYRLAITQLSPEKQAELEKQNKYRDLKVFKTTHGLPVGEITSDRANPFKDKEIKQFKKTSDIGEAASMLPSLIQSALEKADGNPEVLKSELAKLKANSYQTMPNLENKPKEFLDYFTWLSKTQGSEEASQRLADYMLQNEINKVKSQAVPSL